jgi:hypothetical protein
VDLSQGDWRRQLRLVHRAATFFFPDVTADVFFGFPPETDFAEAAFLVDGDLAEAVLVVVDLADFGLLAVVATLADSGLDSALGSESRRWT